MKKEVHEICHKNLTTIHPSLIVSEAITLMRDKQTSYLIVLDSNKLAGIFTERDIVRCIVESGLQFVRNKISQVMRTQVITVNINAFIFEAFDLVLSHNIRHLVVVDDQEQPVGIVTLADLIDHLGYHYFIKVHEVSEIMSAPPITITPDITVFAAVTAMAKFCLSFLVVVNMGEPIGVLTEQDVTSLAMQEIDLQTVFVKEIMSSPVISVTTDTPLAMAAINMQQNKIRRLVVLNENGKLCGVITQSNFVKAMESKYVDTLKEIISNQSGQLAQAIRKLSEKTLYLDSILSTSMGLGVVAANSKGTVELYNSEAERILNLRADDIIGKNFHEIHTMLGIDHDRCDGFLCNIHSKHSHSFSFERMSKDGKLFVQALINGIWDAKGFTGYVMILRDLTTNKLAEDTIKFMAYHDALTNLPNRSSFQERLTTEIARAKRNGSVMAIMILDLNKFKEVNDLFGHLVGDQLLKELAGRMQACLRQSDIVARFGGDEFIFILPEAGSKKYAELIARNILQKIEQPLEIEKITLSPTASIGIACYPLDGDEYEILLRSADNAMYKAKKQSQKTNCSTVVVTT